VLDADQEPDVDAERDERDERRDEAEEGRDEHQGEVVGDREQEGEEGHDCRSDMSREATRGPGADRLDGTRAAQERCFVRVTGMDTLPCPILSEVHTISPDTETKLVDRAGRRRAARCRVEIGAHDVDGREGGERHGDDDEQDEGGDEEENANSPVQTRHLVGC